MTLFDRISTVKSTNPYFTKDLEKSRNATKFIGRGSISSSTEKYRLASKDLANTGHYIQDDIVFISAEGNRKSRLDVDFIELKKAVNVGATFITDTLYDRNRPYNIGERQVAAFLIEEGYSDNNTGVWKK